MKKVLYIARAGLPVDATGLRIAQIGKLFENNGYQIHYLCERRIDGSEEKNGYLPIADDYLTEELEAREVHFQVENRVYSYLPKFRGSKWKALMEAVELITATKAFRRIRRVAEKEKPCYIVLYNSTYPLAKKLIPYCRKRNIILLGDVTEWYEKNENNNFMERFIVSTTDKRIRKADKRFDGIIAISQYFYKYYTDRGVKSILIPPLMTPMEGSLVEQDRGKKNVRFVYAGSPGAKDIILPFIKVVAKANERGIRCRMDLLGIDLDYVHKNGCEEASEERGIYAYGRVPHELVVEIVREADFGVLLRHNQRYAKAGFSTKFAECMSLGVGMICNKIGGTDSFVEDSEDGFLLDSVNEEEIEKLIAQIVALPSKQIMQIKRNALKKAERVFTLKAYQEEFLAFLR